MKKEEPLMHTSVLIVALAAMAADKATPEWQVDYGQALSLAQEQNRPVAVFLAPGKDGWQKLARDGKVSEQALAELASGYVCLRLDTDTEYGKKWAKAFEMSSGLGLVLSDRSGNTQAYRHEGSLDAAALTSALETHSGKVVVTRPSYYPAEAPATVIYQSSPSSTVIYPSSQGRYESNGYYRPVTRSSSYCPT
jgi:hypothetical protein